MTNTGFSRSIAFVISEAAKITIDKRAGDLESIKVVLAADAHLGYNIGVRQMEKMVEKAEPIIAEQLHTSLRGAFRHQKCSQKRNRKKRIYGSRKHNPSSRPENRKACLQPTRNTHEYVNVNDNIYRC